jgi:hypothetical protein
MSKRTYPISNNTRNKKQRTFLPANVCKQVLAYCAPAHTLHKQMWSRIQPVNEFPNGDPYQICEGFDIPVHRYVRDTQTGRTGKKIITENSSTYANYRNCIECAQSVLNTDTQYEFDCDEFTTEPGHTVPCEMGSFSMIRCSNCVL